MSDATPAQVHGVLLKWVNILKGSQPRYFILRGGTLHYHKARAAKPLGLSASRADAVHCRCAQISGVNRAAVLQHELSHTSARRTLVGEATAELAEAAKRCARRGRAHAPPR